MRLNCFGDEWKVVLLDDENYKKDYPVETYTDTRGLTFYDAQLIAVKTDNQEASTLLHEVIHVAERFCGARLKEHQVEAVERGLWTIFKNNPHLLEYFLKHAKE